MTATCIKEDQLGLLKVGERYEYTVINGVYMVGGFGMSGLNFRRLFRMD